MFPNLWSPRNLTPTLQTNLFHTTSRVNHGLTQIAFVEPLIVLTSPLSPCFSRKQQDKVQKAWHGGNLGQTMVDSWYCLDRVVLETMSQVWRRSKVRNHKQDSLNTRLSSNTSANTSCRSRNAPGRMIRSDLFWYGNNLKIKPTYQEKNLLDYLFGGFRSTLKLLCLFTCVGIVCICFLRSTVVRSLVIL